MKKRILMTVLYTLGMLALSGAAVLLIGRMAAAGWQLPVMQSAPANGSSAVEQVENELKAYPYQVLTRSAAEILYKEIAAAGDALTVRTDGEDCISAAEAAALAGGLAETLYGSDLSEKTMDLVPVVYHGADGTLSTAIWLAAYTLPDAVQTAADGSTPPETQGCWLFCLDAADGSLLFSRCTALEGEADETSAGRSSFALSDEAMLALYERTLALADKLGLSPAAFFGRRSLSVSRGAVQKSFLRLEDGSVCRMVFDEHFATGGLYSIGIGEAFTGDVPDPFSWIGLPLALPEAHTLPAAVQLAAAGSGSAGRIQSASYSAANESFAWVNDYYSFAYPDFFVYRIDPRTAARSLLCDAPGCRHRIQDGCTARTGLLRELCAGEGDTVQQLDAESISGLIRQDVLWYIRRSGEDYELVRRDPASQQEEPFAVLPVPMELFGWIGDKLLLSIAHAGVTVIETEAGLQPHDAGWRRSLYACDIETGELVCFYQGEEHTPLLYDVSKGHLWESSAAPAGVQLTCRDLFTGEALPEIPAVLLEGLPSGSTPTHWELAGRYMLLRFYEAGAPRLFMADTLTGEARELPWSDSYNVLTIIGCFGDELLVQQTTTEKHRYYLLALTGLFESFRAERRWVQDDFVIE